MKTSFQVLLACALTLAGAMATAQSAPNSAAPAEYCFTSTIGKVIPDLGDSFNREFGFMGTEQAGAWCGDEKKPRYISRTVFGAVFPISKATEKKLETEVVNKMAADQITKVMEVDYGRGDKFVIYGNQAAQPKAGETLCIGEGSSIRCTPGAKVMIELGESNSEITLFKNGYTLVSPRLKLYKR